MSDAMTHELWKAEESVVKGPSPLLGYNTNVRHKGKLYHIQTEDSGLKHPHVMTHLFTDGGRIIATKKTSYAEHVGAEDIQAVVKKLMQQQHKAMFIALRDGLYDENEPAPAVVPDRTQPVSHEPPVDFEALEQAAARLAHAAAKPAAPPPVPPAAMPPPVPPQRTVPRRPSSPSGRYQATVPAEPASGSQRVAAANESIFGGDLVSEKSLDEVILSYLAEDLEAPKK